MHRVIRDRLEEVLAQTPGADLTKHLKDCEECRVELEQMRAQAGLLRTLRPAEEVEPRGGFYARVMERIEAEGPISIWNLFIESAFGRRIAVASLALALLIGVYVVTSERSAEDVTIALQSPQMSTEQTIVAGEDAPAREITRVDQSQTDESSQDAVLANLVTYREQ